jgi:hypothetical protein
MEEIWDYDADLFGDVMDSAVDYHQTGWTVCGAEDPAVITLGKEFGEMHPALAGYEVVRVIDKYVNPSKSDTLLEFSNRDMTDEEYRLYEELVEEESNGN